MGTMYNRANTMLLVVNARGSLVVRLSESVMH